MKANVKEITVKRDEKVLSKQKPNRKPPRQQPRKPKAPAKPIVKKPEPAKKLLVADHFGRQCIYDPTATKPFSGFSIHYPDNVVEAEDIPLQFGSETQGINGASPLLLNAAIIQHMENSNTNAYEKLAKHFLETAQALLVANTEFITTGTRVSENLDISKLKDDVKGVMARHLKKVLEREMGELIELVGEVRNRVNQDVAIDVNPKLHEMFKHIL